jgi:CDP-diacylglycerol--serine O-phosphatidyltransferase
MTAVETPLPRRPSYRDVIRRAPFVEMGRFMDVANGLTLMGLAAAINCVLLAMNQLVAYAVISLMVSGLCDLFDGVLARRLSGNVAQRQFGARLDSIVDACSFGIAPVVLMYAAGLNHPVDVPLLLLFASAAVWRLAYFDTVGLVTEGNVRYFSGLPTTYVALFLPIVFLPGIVAPTWLRGTLLCGVAGLAFAMVSTVPIRKPSGVFYLLFPTIGLGLTTVFIVYADRFTQE